MIVTGASSGIGRDAEQFAAGGANVFICSREQENVDLVAEIINEASDGGDGNAVATARVATATVAARSPSSVM